MYKHGNQFELFEKIEKKLEKIKCNHCENDKKKILENVDEKLESMESIIETQKKQLEENNAIIASFMI